MNIVRLTKGYAIPLLCGISFFFLMKFIFFFGYVPTGSMAPTIPEKSYVFGMRVYGELQKGDIVVFKHEGAALIKRIAAVPGETVYINDRISDVRIGDELLSATRILTVPENHFFILGDNPDDSIDSRTWNEPFISGDQIIAKLWHK